MKRRMAPHKWNNNRNDRNENHHGYHQQHNQQHYAAESNDETNGENSYRDDDTVEYTVKILIPNQTAWSISSRNETKISWMADKFGSDVRLSRNDDFYPNTMERICMIIGTKKQIKDTIQWILNINGDVNESYSINMLVPKTSLGSILARGYGIQALRERNHVDIHVPEHNPDCVLREVCTKITGKKDNIIEGIIAIAKITLTDQFSAVCKNISYEEFNIYLKRKEHNSLMPNFGSMPRISMQQLPAITMNNTNWIYQSPMQSLQNQNMQQENQFQQYQRQNFLQLQQEQQSYQPAVYTNQLKSFYNHNNRQQYQRQQQISPFCHQQQQCADFIAKTNNRLQVDNQQEQLEQIQEQTVINNEEKTIEPTETDNDKSNTGDNETKGDNEAGNPIPSVTSIWRRASSDNWRFGNNRPSINGQSNVEVIPGLM